MIIHINYWAVIIASVAQFLLGWFWFTFLFGNLWAKMHGHDECSKEEQEKMKSEMGPLMI
ncbi:DUF1761 domain-containing protein [Candidatus Azambacteria bacterium]|nr:DUF1761 domain-containing protein [Candidatus Azambacteria bacterium]